LNGRFQNGWPNLELEVASDKTRTLRFGRKGGSHNGRFDFLGFEFYWEPDRQGKPRVKRRTATKKYLAGKQRIREWIKDAPSPAAQALDENPQGQAARDVETTYGLIGNYRRDEAPLRRDLPGAAQVAQPASQRQSIRWRSLNRLLQRFQVPQPRIVEKNGQRMPCQRDFSFLSKAAYVAL